MAGAAAAPGALGQLFEHQGQDYATYRLGYPRNVYETIYAFADLPHKRLAVDVACGTGQAAVGLAQDFEAVVGLDSAQKQIEHATARTNVSYRQVGRSGCLVQHSAACAARACSNCVLYAALVTLMPSYSEKVRARLLAGSCTSPSFQRASRYKGLLWLLLLTIVLELCFLAGPSRSHWSPRSISRPGDGGTVHTLVKQFSCFAT